MIWKIIEVVFGASIEEMTRREAAEELMQREFRLVHRPVIHVEPEQP